MGYYANTMLFEAIRKLKNKIKIKIQSKKEENRR